MDDQHLGTGEPEEQRPRVQTRILGHGSGALSEIDLEHADLHHHRRGRRHADRPAPAEPGGPRHSRQFLLDLRQLYNRVTNAKLTHGIRGVFWHQGESNSGSDARTGDWDYKSYQQYFLEMASGLEDRTFRTFGNTSSSRCNRSPAPWGPKATNCAKSSAPCRGCSPT